VFGLMSGGNFSRSRRAGRQQMVHCNALGERVFAGLSCNIMKQMKFAFGDESGVRSCTATKFMA
jgi:hypothetical protein